MRRLQCWVRSDAEFARRWVVVACGALVARGRAVVR